MSILKKITLDLAKNIVLDDKVNLLNAMNECDDFSNCRWSSEKSLTLLPKEKREEFFLKYKITYKKKATETFGFVYCHFMDAFEMRLSDKYCIVDKDEIEMIIINEMDKIIFEKIQEIELTNSM